MARAVMAAEIRYCKAFLDQITGHKRRKPRRCRAIAWTGDYCHVHTKKVQRDLQRRKTQNASDPR